MTRGQNVLISTFGFSGSPSFIPFHQKYSIALSPWQQTHPFSWATQAAPKILRNNVAPWGHSLLFARNENLANYCTSCGQVTGEVVPSVAPVAVVSVGAVLVLLYIGLGANSYTQTRTHGWKTQDRLNLSFQVWDPNVFRAHFIANFFCSYKCARLTMVIWLIWSLVRKVHGPFLKNTPGKLAWKKKLQFLCTLLIWAASWTQFASK